VYGGSNAPYVWVQFPGRDSWEVFQQILEKANIVVTPGVGFGGAGQGFVRCSAFSHRETLLEAIDRLKILFGNDPLETFCECIYVSKVHA
jgi:LL-diaminopimelate aminotransferase